MEGNRVRKRKIYHWEKVSVLLVIFDIIAICVSYGAALWLRFDLHYLQIPTEYLQTFIRFIPEYTVIAIIIYSFLHLYRSIWLCPYAAGYWWREHCCFSIECPFPIMYLV